MSDNDAARFARDMGNITSNDYDGDPRTAAKEFTIRERLHFPVLPADSAANTTVAANVQYGRTARHSGRVVLAGIVVGTNVTADAADYKVISIEDQDGNVLATVNTQDTANSGTGNLTALTTVTFAANTDTANAAAFSENDFLVPVIGIGGSGVQMPLTAYWIDVEWEAS